MKKWKAWAAGAIALSIVGAANAGSVFQGRLADGTPSSTCTGNSVKGKVKCTFFYDSDLNVTIINPGAEGPFLGFHSVVTGTWNPAATVGSAQFDAAIVGAYLTGGLLDWTIPTGDGTKPAGAQNEFLSIWDDVGGTYAGLKAQFDLVGETEFWSSSANPRLGVASGWAFNANTGSADSYLPPFVAEAVLPIRDGDIAAPAVPEPQNLMLFLLGIGAMLVAARNGRLEV